MTQPNHLQDGGAAETTYIRPEYRRTSVGHSPIDGVQFFSYSIGITRYARISEDGQIMVSANGRYSGYNACVIGHGYILSKPGLSNRHKTFRLQDAAAKAAIKIWRKLQAARS